MVTSLVIIAFCLLIGLPFLNLAMLVIKPSLYKKAWVDGVHANGTVKRYQLAR